MQDFTLEKYAALCHAIADSNYQTVRIADYLKTDFDQLPEYVLLLRHDVDVRPDHALKLAQIESDVNLVATYYYRTAGYPFAKDPMMSIAQLGHEIGYHYETMSQTSGDIDAAIELFGDELNRMRDVVQISSASMHGSPLKPWDNRAIWENIAPIEFDLVGEAYIDIDYSVVHYFSDTGRSWHPFRYNVRDNPDKTAMYQPETTDDIIQDIKTHKFKHLCLTTHPERWADSTLDWYRQATRDVMANMIKTAIKQIYRLK